MKMLAIIPARAGSKRLPGKNLREIAGISLVENACWTAKSINMPAVVTTDDEKILAIGKRNGCEVIMRPEPLSGDGAQMRDVVRHALEAHPTFDAFCLLQPTSPLRVGQDVMDARRMFIDLCGTSLISVAAGSKRPNGAIYMGRSSLFLEHGLFIEDGIILRNGLEMHAETLRYEMPVERSIDVDTLEDFERCEDYLLGPRRVYADGHVGREPITA